MVDYVYYDNTDCGGIVYHTNYIVFCERARSRIFFDKSMFPNSDDAAFVVRNIESNFISPLRLGDKYEIKSKLLEIKNTFMIINQEIYKIGEIGNKEILNELCFSMIIKMAFISLETKKPHKIPNNIIEILKEYQKTQ